MAQDTNLHMLLTLISRLPAKDSGNEARIAGGQLELVFEQMSKLSELENNPDPMKSALAISIAVEKQRAILNEVYTQAKNRINAEIEKYKLANVNNRLVQSNLAPNEFAEEIRSVFRSLDLSGKYQYLNDCIESGNGAGIAPLVLGVPTLLSGLSAQEQEKFKDSYLDKWSDYESSWIDSIESVTRIFLDSVRPYTLPVNKVAAEAA